MKNLFYFVLLLGFMACTGITEQTVHEEPVKINDLIYHYSVLKALDNGVLEGSMKVTDLMKQGDHGLGTFNGLNGEMIVIDHTVYRVTPEGEVVEAEDDMLIPYTIVSFFEPDKSISHEGDENLDYDNLISMMDTLLPSQNQFYAFRITGSFKYIKCGGVDRQERPYNKTILGILADRPVYEKEDISGTLVGFWCPAYIGDINTQGFHLHFLADDRSMGGHLIAFEASSLEIQYDIKTGYKIILPDTEDFKSANFRESAVNY
jgi:acetolactate decarboxylase